MVLEATTVVVAFLLALAAGAVAGFIVYACFASLLWCVDRHRLSHGAGAPPADPDAVKVWLPEHAHRGRRRQGSSDDDDECSICLGVLEDGQRCCTLPACRHEFHRECIYGWLANHNTCPLCRHKAVPAADGAGPTPPPAAPRHHDTSSYVPADDMV
ncbi:hypothetical protein ABZP36_034500 [Zizania latifolia]